MFSLTALTAVKPSQPETPGKPDPYANLYASSMGGGWGLQFSPELYAMMHGSQLPQPQPQQHAAEPLAEPTGDLLDEIHAAEREHLAMQADAALLKQTLD